MRGRGLSWEGSSGLQCFCSHTLRMTQAAVVYTVALAARREDLRATRQQRASFPQLAHHFLSVCFPSSQTARPGDGACRLLFAEGVTGQECFLSAPFPPGHTCTHECVLSGSGLLEGGIQKGMNRLMASICPGTVLQNKEVWSTSAHLSWVYFTLRVGDQPRS